jgi:hypothetical protein
VMERRMCSQVTGMNRRALALLGTAALAAIQLVACDGEVLVVGGSPDGGNWDSTSPYVDGSAPVGSPSGGADYECWFGYFSQFQFPSGSNELNVCWSLRGGPSDVGLANYDANTRLPDAPRDPDLGYPVVPDAGSYDSLTLGPWAPWGYTMVNGSRDATHQTFDIAPYEFYQGWCELQTSYPHGGGSSYGCLPDAQIVHDASGCGYVDAAGRHAVDCDKTFLCEKDVCTCAPQGCTVTPGAANGPRFHFELTVSGNNATGTVTGLDGASVVRLARPMQ